ncbi:hypothetical protein HWV62_15525 [Athelia sp. TMB]|nr:hypothetical protein HWV62_15525 [Athelia sp. TMB]
MQPTDDSLELTEPTAAAALEIPIKQLPGFLTENGLQLPTPSVRSFPVETTTASSFFLDVPRGPATITPSTSESAIMDLANNDTGVPTRRPTQSSHISTTLAVANSALGVPDLSSEPESSALLVPNDVSNHSQAKGTLTRNTELMQLQLMFQGPGVTPIASEPKVTASSLSGKPTALFVSGYTAGNVFNIAGDFYEANNAPHALDILKLLDPVVMNASYRHQCMAGTRQVILQNFTYDLTTPSLETSAIWLTGVAGSGKSTIATTIAEHIHARGQLGAFLFFDRNTPSLSTPDAVIRTLAYQLAMSNKALRDAICDAIERDPQIATRTLSHQFSDLLFGPLQSCASKITKPIVIILDAFDECGDPLSRRSLAYLLAEKLPLLPPQYRFLITGRPQLDLVNMFASRPRVKSVSLNDSEWASDTDVLLYIQHEMDQLCQMRQASDELPLDWPGTSKVRKLGARAADSFIYAATAMRYMYSANDLDERLDSLLEQTAFTLEDLYATALRSASNWDPDEVATESCRKILGAVVVGQIALTDDTIVDILGFEKSKACRLVLRKLGCVLQWSDGLPVRTLHASFTDYLTDPRSCADQPWFIDVRKYHLEFTLGCLRVMKQQLRFNICGLETSYLLNRDVPNLAVRIENCIPRCLSYSCRFWVEHFTRTDIINLQVSTLILEFFRSLFLHWLEVLSLIEEGRTALPAMIAVETYGKVSIFAGHRREDMLKGAQGRCADAQMFIRDSVKFVRAFASVISDSAPHIYISALPFAPSASILKQQYATVIQNNLRACTADVSDWPCCEQVHFQDEIAASIAFSPDGSRIASGSTKQEILIWDSHTGEIVIGPLKGHAGTVNAVAYSPNGERIVSGSDDETLRIWDTQTGGVSVKSLEGHTGPVTSVAFSPNEAQVASGSTDKTVCIWDAQTGDLAIGPLAGHTETVNGVAFSPDGKCVMSGSNDKTVRIWDAHTGKHVVKFEGDTWEITSVAYSPDGKHILIGSDDYNVCLWSARTGELVRIFQGHTHRVTCVAVSPNGLQAVSGSYDNTVRVWDLHTGALVAVFQEHSDCVTTVAFSPDGLHFASGSSDGTVRCWDAGASETSSKLSPLIGHTENVTSVAFSPDGLNIVSGSDDLTVRIWDATTGALVVPLIGHAAGVTSVAFSPDGSQILSSSGDRTIRMWGVKSGTRLAERSTGHSSYVKSLAFSPNGKNIVTGSNKMTVCICDAQTGTLVAGPCKGHTDWVFSVAFSPDGTLIASGSNDSTVRVWDAQTGDLATGPLQGHKLGVTSVVFSPDGQNIASGSRDGTIRIWQAWTGESVKIIGGEAGGVTSVAFSPDGQNIVSGSYDGAIRLWNVHTGVLLAAYGRHTGTVTSVVFSPDGTRIASGSMDKTIHILHVRAATAPHAGKGFRPTSQLVNGWMQNGPTELLFWVPPAYRTGLWWPDSIAIGQRASQLDLTKFVHGEDWTQCRI